MTFVSPVKLTADVIPSDMKPGVVFVGGGPVGLWTAIQTKLLSEKEEVVVLEKYNDYQRSDIRLEISAGSLKGIPKDDALQNIIKEWPKKPVPIKEMESALAKRAHELGIKILKGYQADPKTLPELFPKAKIFIGADGARSGVRQEIFNDEFKFNSTLQYMAQVQYLASQAPEMEDSCYAKVQDLSDSYKMQKFAKHIVVQTTRPQSDEVSRVTLQIFIDKATYDQITDATFKNPYYFKTHLSKVPGSLKDVLVKWWGARSVLHHELIDSDNGDSHKITAIPLKTHAVKEIFKKDPEGHLWALVGDAAQIYPLRRAINNGFLLGTKLAKSLSEGLKNDNKPLESYLVSYSRYATLRAYIERVRAVVKNWFINCVSLWYKISNRLPFQAVSLSEKIKEKIQKNGEAIWKELSQTTS